MNRWCTAALTVVVLLVPAGSASGKEAEQNKGSGIRDRRRLRGGDPRRRA